MREPDPDEGGEGEGEGGGALAHPLPVAVRRVWRAYASGACADGIAAGEAAISDLGDHGEAWFAIACCHERAGDLLASDRCFGRAARAHHEQRTRPWRVSWHKFGDTVDAAIEAMPSDMRAVLEQEVTLVLADYPETAAESALVAEGDELLGHFDGPVRADRAVDDLQGGISPRISIFRRAHEHLTDSADEFRAEVRRTLVHELGHYIGFDEDGLKELDLD